MPPECPDWVIGEAREVWDRKVAELEPMGLAFKADEDALAMYCVAVANLAQAQRLLDASTPLVKGPGGTAVKNPAHTLIYNYAAVAHRLGRDFGFTPAARANMSQTERAERDDEATRLLS
jgi:P27 family predicted phage terminase small subunit